jgi:hypothetical protein
MPLHGQASLMLEVRTVRVRHETTYTGIENRIGLASVVRSAELT